MYSNELASLNRSFAEQTANTAGFTGVNSGIADLRYTVATEACADRAAISDALRDVIAANTASTQRILDQLCADKIESKNDTIAQLRSELLYARGQASQDVQTAAIRASQATTANQLVAELRSCPIPAQPVYGNQPIFSCPQTITPGCGCGCGA
jgi:ABC-type iron transport system FetAB permease component